MLQTSSLIDNGLLSVDTIKNYLFVSPCEISKQFCFIILNMIYKPHLPIPASDLLDKPVVRRQWLVLVELVQANDPIFFNRVHSAFVRGLVLAFQGQKLGRVVDLGRWTRTMATLSLELNSTFWHCNHDWLVGWWTFRLMTNWTTYDKLGHYFAVTQVLEN